MHPRSCVASCLLRQSDEVLCTLPSISQPVGRPHCSQVRIKMPLIAKLLRAALYLALLSLVAYSTVLISESDVGNPEIRLEQGTVRGVQEGGIEYFRGVRYALDTSNEGRFRRPKPVWEHLGYKFPPESIQINRTLPWQGVYDASFFAPSCPQL